MSSAVLSTTAAPGRPFIFDADTDPEVSCHPERSGKYAKRISRGVEEPALSLPKGSLPSPDPRLANILPASRLEIRPTPEMVSSGIPAIDALTGGLPRGCLTEICGPASSGRTTVLLAALAAATRRGEYCALIDASDSLDPHSAAAAGLDLDRLLWVRCGERPPSSGQGHRIRSRNSNPAEHRLEQVLRATDFLLESGGFGLIVLDLADLPSQDARRIPLTTWFRFRRAVEHKPTILLAIEHHPIAGSCSSILLQLGIADELAAERRKSAAHACPERSRRGASRGWATTDFQALEGRKNIRNTGQSAADPQGADPSHTHLFTGLNINAELIRSRLGRKPARSETFATKTAWAG